MEPRQRVLRSMGFEEPDRVPIDFAGHRSSGIMALAYTRLHDYLGLPKRLPKVYDFPQQLAVIDEDVLDRLGIDCIEMGRGFCLDDSWWKPWELPDGEECLIPTWINPVRRGDDWVVFTEDGQHEMAIQKEGMIYFDELFWPFADNPESAPENIEWGIANEMWASLSSPPGPVPYDDAGMRYLASGAKALRASTQRAIIGLFGGSLFEICQRLFRVDNFYAYLVARPDLLHRTLER